MKNMNLKKALFELDTIEGVFIGYDELINWNGFGCPFFEKEVGLQIVESFNKTYGSSAFYDEELDTFVFYAHCASTDLESARKELHKTGTLRYEDFDIYKGEIKKINGKEIKVYDIGNYSWTWYVDPIK